MFTIIKIIFFGLIALILIGLLLSGTDDKKHRDPFDDEGTSGGAFDL